MSEWHVQVVQLGKIGKHPNADTLSITQIHDGYPCIFRTGDFKEGDLAVYVPVDSIVPIEDSRFSFLAGHPRIKAKKLRGVFSMGILVAPNADFVLGQIVHEPLGITKYEPDTRYTLKGDNEKDPGFIPIYTDIESYRKYPKVIKQGEEVILCEKLHGSSARYLVKEDRLWVGSHKMIKKDTEGSLWWTVAHQYDLATKLATAPDKVFYGEVYGQVQDLKYGAKQNELFLAIFDVFDIQKGLYLDWDNVVELCVGLGLPTTPLLYRGPWHPDFISMANGPSTLADHTREGFVIRPVTERWDLEVGRVILKLVGEDYLLRKE